ncbi:hypothetical protein VP01_8013g2, partial [Puccinia sorghi]
FGNTVKPLQYIIKEIRRRSPLDARIKEISNKHPTKYSMVDRLFYHWSCILVPYAHPEEPPQLKASSVKQNICGREWVQHLVETSKTSAHIHPHTQGSILADDMGLGKTLTSLALVTSSKHAAESFVRSHEVCPLCTLANWEAEIHKHFELNVAAYLVYHGNERKNLTRKVIFDSNIVLVT